MVSITNGKVQKFEVERFKVQRFKVQKIKVQQFRVEKFKVQTIYDHLGNSEIRNTIIEKMGIAI